MEANTDRMILTFFNLLSGQLLTGSGRPLHNVGEADTNTQKLPVIVSIHGAWYQPR